MPTSECAVRQQLCKVLECRSGKLGGAELLELGAWVWKSFNPGKEPSDEQISAESAKILKRIDANNDGELDFAEFSAYYERTAASIARFHKKKAQIKKERKKKGSRSSSVSANPESCVNCSR